jgi:hypothetical protein
VGNATDTGVLAVLGSSAAPSEEDVRAHVEKILHSRALGSSEMLRKLLAFYAARTVDRSGPPKEHEIATLGLGRRADFDPRVDSTVRVQTGRLRSKLAEYYAQEGAGDAVVLEIPKGSYLLECHYRARVQAPPVPAPAIPQPAETPHRPWRTIALAVILLVAGSTVGFLVLRKGSAAPESVLRLFWQDFIQGPNTPLVVFSNPRFVGSSAEALRYFHEGGDSVEAIDDSYTGTGEVIAVHELTKVFARFGAEMRVKRAQLLSWDDAKHSNLILIGSPEQNVTMADMPWLQEFRFKPYNAEPRTGQVGIINLHPRPGEEPFYFGSPKRPIRYEYGVVALVRGITPDRRTVILAGTGTLGTQAAAEFVSTPAGVSEILARIGVPKTSRVPPFEAIVYVQVNGGVPVDTRLMLVRRAAAGH